MKNRSSISIRALLLAVALVLVVNIAHADPTSDVLHGCTKTKTGVLRMLQPGESCRVNETPIEWNQQGAPGPAGTAAPAAFHMESGAFDPTDDEVWANFPCPDGMMALGGTAWTSDGWNLRRPLAVELVGEGDSGGSGFRNYAHVDWEVPLDAGDAVFYNITCGAV